MLRSKVKINNNRRFYAVATLLLVVFTVLLSLVIEQKKLPEQAIKTQVILTKAFSNQDLKKPHSVEISLSNYELPAPSVMSFTSKQVLTQTKNQALQKKTITKSSKQSSDAEAKQQLQKLSEMNGDSLQLNYPDSISKTNEILKYMHNCIGIDLAAYTGENLIMLKQKQGSHSPMLRIASGHLTQFERSLLDLYASEHPLARLYPMWFDMRLSRKIHEHSAGAALQNFSGVYQLQGKTLWLQNIKINNKTLSESWLLADANSCR